MAFVRFKNESEKCLKMRTLENAINSGIDKKIVIYFNNKLIACNKQETTNKDVILYMSEEFTGNNTISMRYLVGAVVKNDKALCIEYDGYVYEVADAKLDGELLILGGGECIGQLINDYEKFIGSTDARLEGGMAWFNFNK